MIVQHQRIVAVRRLLGKDINRSPAHAARIQSAQQCSFVDNSAPRRIDDQHTRSHLLESRIVQEACGLRSARNVNRDRVRARQHFIERNEFHLCPGFGRSRQKRIERDHLHSETLGTARNDATDVSESNDREGSVVEFHSGEARLLPLSGLHRCGRLRDVARKRNQQRNRVFGSGDVVTARCVHHHDSARGGRRNVDVVDADPRPANDLEFLCGCDHVGGHLSATANHEPLNVGYGREQFVTLQAGFGNHRDPGRVFEDFETLRIQLVAHQYFCHDSSLRGARENAARHRLVFAR